MDETIETEDVRRRYTTGAPGSTLSRHPDAVARAGEEFDLWLAEETRVAKRAGWDEAADWVARNSDVVDSTDAASVEHELLMNNPYLED